MAEDYEVGYRKPPKHSRFKPGVSPNPSGRPKRSPTFLEEFQAELNTRVEVQENGRRRRLTKRRLITKQVVNGAVKGDRACLRMAQTVMAILDERAVSAVDKMTSKERAAVDKAIMQSLAATFAAGQSEGGDGGGENAE